MRLNIGSKILEFELPDEDIARYLRPELAQYPSATDEPDLLVRIGGPTTSPSVAHNPATVRVGAATTTFRYGYVDVTWYSGTGPARVDLRFWGHRYRWRRKLLGLQYTHPIEDVGQFFHELIAIPATLLYFREDLTVVHASALQAPGRGAILLCGTGGVGKTSLALHLGRAHGHRFLADDMCLVDRRGTVWPNLAHPKIYAYNLQSDRELRAAVFEGRGPLDRIAWGARRWLPAAAGVRRRTPARRIYPQGVAPETPLDRVVFVFRQSVPSPSLEPLSDQAAADMATRVLATEYAESLFNRLSWLSYNQQALSAGETTTPELILQDSRRLLQQLFSRARVEILRLPLELRGVELHSQVAPMIAR